MLIEISKQKALLRRQYRKKRQLLTTCEMKSAAAALFSRFIDDIVVPHNSIVAAYIAIDHEIDVTPIMEFLSEKNHTILVPSLALNIAEFWPVTGTQPADIIPSVVVTPLVAFDQYCNRIGFGKGWYDKTISKLRPLGVQFIGVGYDMQFYPKIPVDCHDMPLDIIITDRQTIKSSSSDSFLKHKL